MFKPTKPQHIVNKKYADENGGGGSGDESVVELVLMPSGGEEDYPNDYLKNSVVQKILNDRPKTVKYIGMEPDGLNTYFTLTSCVPGNNRVTYYSFGASTGEQHILRVNPDSVTIDFGEDGASTYKYNPTYDAWF